MASKSYGLLFWDWVSTFRAPRFIDIQDVRLGVSNRVLQAAVMVYFILIMSISKEYEIKYTPKGFNQYYISAGTMYTDQDSSYWNDICANAVMETMIIPILIATLVIPSGVKKILAAIHQPHTSLILRLVRMRGSLRTRRTHILSRTPAVLSRDSLTVTVHTLQVTTLRNSHLAAACALVRIR